MEHIILGTIFLVIAYFSMTLTPESKETSIYTDLEPDDVEETYNLDHILMKMNLPSFLPYDEYVAYLRSDSWLNKKMDRFHFDDGICQQCKIELTFKESHCHHINYKNLKFEKLSEIITLCRDCHNEVHEYHGKNAVNYPILIKGN